MNSCAADSNVLIKYLSGSSEAKLLLESADELFVPVTVVGEMLYGVEKSRRKLDNFVKYLDFLAQFELLPTTNNTAHYYAEIKAQLVAKGINLPENDIWIAAAAIENGLTLLTFDKHFSHIKKLAARGFAA